MKIFSKWYYDENESQISELSLDVLACELKRADHVVIISAYYSIGFIEKIVSLINKTNRKNKKLEFIFNGFGGQRLHNQIKELTDLIQYLEGVGFKDIYIYLNRGTTLFHTKLYYIKNDNGSVWFSGSPNASFSAFNSNEELLFKSRKNINAIKRYISYVKEDSELVNEIDLEGVIESNVIGFFRTGSLYFKPTVQLSFTFSDLKLPSWVENEIGNIDRPRNTNPGKAWGSYNLKISLGINFNEDDQESNKISLKPWSIETCYGYWVPSLYCEYVDSSIRLKSKDNKKIYSKILNCINKRGLNSLVSDYSEYLNDVKNILSDNNIDYEIDSSDLLDKFENFIISIISRLSNSKKLDRLCTPLVSSGMPEIWEDKIAFDDFKESYFEYISSCLNEKKLPKVVRSIVEEMDVEKGFSSDEVEKMVYLYFDNEEEWSDDCWYEK